MSFTNNVLSLCFEWIFLLDDKIQVTITSTQT
jgi:hypothetical protein